MARAEKKLQEERATLSRYDDELKALEQVIKAKKQEISNADLDITKHEHDIVSLKREMTVAENQATNLEKQYDWIVEEQELVAYWICPMIITLTASQSIREARHSIRLFQGRHQPAEDACSGAAVAAEWHEAEDQSQSRAHDRRVSEHISRLRGLVTRASH